MTYRPVQWRLRYNAGNVEKATGAFGRYTHGIHLVDDEKGILGMVSVKATDCPDADPVQGIEYSAADLHEILYGEESE
jgi:hypothetical protein